MNDKEHSISFLLDKIKRNNSLRWIDKLHFLHIFLIWFLIILFFGLVYFYASFPASSLLYSNTQAPIDNVFDAIYFSFVSATTTGFGDIVPLGWFKLIAVFEVIGGLLLLALVTSRLVSIKQDAILNEVYEISFNERINRLRSSLLLFRQNLDRTINRVEENNIKLRELKSINAIISSFQETLEEIFILVDKTGSNEFIKSIDSVNTELLLNSVLTSFEKFMELINLLDENKVKWKEEFSHAAVKDCVLINERLFSKISSSRLTKEKVTDLLARKEVIIQNIKSSFR